MKKIITYLKNINFIKALLCKIFEKIKKTIIYYGLFFIILAIIFIFFKPLYNRGTSMNPTIDDKDFYIVNSYKKYTHDIHRGDVVAFLVEKEMLVNHVQIDYKLFRVSKFLFDMPIIYIKRIIALEGDTFEVNNNGDVLINGEILQEDYILEKPEYTFNRITVPQSKCIVLGDNRNNSYDSYYFGVVPIKNIVGVIEFRLFPIKSFGKID